MRYYSKQYFYLKKLVIKRKSYSKKLLSTCRGRKIKHRAWDFALATTKKNTVT